jgi:hypothetical protein
MTWLPHFAHLGYFCAASFILVVLGRRMDEIRYHFQRYVAMADSIAPSQDDFMIRWVLLGGPFPKFLDI